MAELDLRPGDEMKFGKYYGLVLRTRPHLLIRIRRGGPHGAFVDDLAFGYHPTRGELATAIETVETERRGVEVEDDAEVW